MSLFRLMFTFFKDKLKNVISTFTEKVVEEGRDVPVSEKKKATIIKNIVKEEKKEAPNKKEEMSIVDQLRERISTKKISTAQFEKLFWVIEVELLENNVAFEVIEKIQEDLKNKLVDMPMKRGEIEASIRESLRKSVEEVLEIVEPFDLLAKIKAKKEKPYVICFVGVNGSGKTTSIAKVASLLKENGISCVLAAADTFRAAATEQLEVHGEKLGIKVIKQNYGADPTAVAFDAVKHAQQKKIDAVLIDTAGRQHSNVNLRDEMKKIIRIIKPDLKIYVGEMIAGNDCIDQIKDFDAAISIDGVILSKADIDEKGGTALSVSYVTQKPIIYLGLGQEYKDLKPFRAEEIVRNLGL